MADQENGPTDAGNGGGGSRAVVRPMRGNQVIKEMPTRIKETMRVNGIKVEAVAKKANMDPKKVESILEGKEPMDIEDFIDLAQGMDYTPGGLLNRMMKQ